MNEQANDTARPRPEITVIMPVRNEEEFILRAIRSVLVSGERIGSFEVIVVDGLSEDRTRELVEELRASTPSLSLLLNREMTVPDALNLGFRAARADVVVRLDGHAEVEPDFLAACLRELEAHPECACVGGPIESIELNAAAPPVSVAMSSPFGVGNARFRTGGAEGYVDTLAFGAYRKADLFAVGLFDEELVRNQDDELNFRLIQAGRKIWFSHAIRSRYYVRSSLDKLFKQYFQYGYWKVFVNRKHSVLTNLRQLAPPLFLVTLLVLAVVGLVDESARLALAGLLLLYLGAAALFAARSSVSSGRLLGVIASFITLHTSYGLGYLAGVRDFFVLRRPPSTRSAELSR